MPQAAKVLIAKTLLAIVNEFKLRVTSIHKPDDCTRTEFQQLILKSFDLSAALDELERDFNNEKLPVSHVLNTMRTLSELAIKAVQDENVDNLRLIAEMMDPLIEEANFFVIIVTRSKEEELPELMLARQIMDAKLLLQPQRAEQYDRKIIESLGWVRLHDRLKFYSDDIKFINKDIIYQIGAYFINSLAGQRIDLPEQIIAHLRKQIFLIRSMHFDYIPEFKLAKDQEMLQRQATLYSYTKKFYTKEYLESMLGPKSMGGFRNSGYIWDCLSLAKALTVLDPVKYGEKIELIGLPLSLNEINDYAKLVLSAMDEYTAENRVNSEAKSELSLLAKPLKEIINLDTLSKNDKVKFFKNLFNSLAGPVRPSV